MTTTADYSPGLEGIIAGTTKICTVSPEGTRLTYRGYDVEELVEHCKYEDVSYLLMEGDLPDASQRVAFRQLLASQRALPEAVLQAMACYPKNTNAMDGLKAAVTLLALYDADSQDNSLEATKRKGCRLMAQMPTIVAAHYRLQQGLQPVAPNYALSHAADFLTMLTGTQPSASVEKMMNAILIIYAEHGFNASTFSARVTVSTLSDMHSGIGAAIGTLKGSLHGGANEQAMLMFLDIASPDNVEAWLKEALADKKKVMGFGHREYKNGDPRARLLTRLRSAMVAEHPDAPWPAIADKLEALLGAQKGLQPNVDYPIAYLLYMMGLPTPIYTPIFAVGRIAGWASHVYEQLSNNRLIRPKQLYEGFELRSVPVSAAN